MLFLSKIGGNCCLNFLEKRPRLVNVRAYGRQQGIQEKSTEHFDDYGETSNAAVLDTTIVIEQSQQNVSHVDPSGNLLVAFHGTELTPFVAGTNSRGRHLQQNNLRECPGATSYAQKKVKTNTPACAWFLIIDRFILEYIQSCTINEAHRQARCKDFTLSV